MSKKKQPNFIPGGIFHVYNHANGWENVFKVEDNYRYFLQKMGKFIPGVVKVLTYCLLPNHFHIMVKVREKPALNDFYQQKYQFSEEEMKNKILLNSLDYHTIVRQQFTNFLAGYVQSFNRYHKRKGSLLMQNTNRKVVGTERYFMNMIHYLHFNAVHHHIVVSLEDWPHSSYHSILSERPTLLERKEILCWFGGRDAFIKFHGQEPKNNLGFTKDLECDF